MHNDAIELPEGYELLASSDRCNVQMMRDRRRPLFYSTQFHPEFYNAQLIYNFIDLVENPQPKRAKYVPPPPVLSENAETKPEMFVTETVPATEGGQG